MRVHSLCMYSSFHIHPLTSVCPGCVTWVSPGLCSHGTSFVYLSLNQLELWRRVVKMAFGALFLVRLCLTLVVIEVCTMLYKVLCKENGLQEANGRANKETRCRTGVFLSSDDDCCSLNHSKRIEILWSLRLSDSTPTPLRQRRSGCSLYFFVSHRENSM